MRLRKFNPIAQHISGKQLVVPDTLSRSPLSENTNDAEEEVNLYVNSVVRSLPISDRRLERVWVTTAEDPELSEVLRKTQYGWPDYEKSIEIEIRPYFTARSELSVWNSILL